MEKQVKPQPGDLIWANRMAKGRPYNHCGIYEGAGYVIHFAAPDGTETNHETAVVHRTGFENFKDGCPVKVIEIENSFPADETLRRARSCIGMRGYNFATFNCDHVATWCKTGEYRSLQVDEVKNILKAIGGKIGGPAGSVVEVICEIHDIAETINFPRIDSASSKHGNDVLDTLETNAYLGQTIPPVPDEENDIQTDYEILEEEPIADDETGEDDGEESSGDKPSGKTAKFEKVYEKLRDLSYPIASALEFLKRKGKLPAPMQKVDYNSLSSKVRSVIDGVDTAIKMFTGRMTLEQAIETLKNNEFALMGKTIIIKHLKGPVKDALKQAYGSAGSIIKHVAQQALTKISSPPVRDAIKDGAKLLGKAAAYAMKHTWPMVKDGMKNIFGELMKQKLFG